MIFKSATVSILLPRVNCVSGLFGSNISRRLSLSYLYHNVLQFRIFNFDKIYFINDVAKIMQWDFSYEYFLFEIRVNLATIFENI